MDQIIHSLNIISSAGYYYEGIDEVGCIFECYYDTASGHVAKVGMGELLSSSLDCSLLTYSKKTYVLVALL